MKTKRSKFNRRTRVSRLKNKKIFLLALVLIIGVIGAVLLYNKDSGNLENANGSNDSGGYINLDPPTEEDKASVDENKQDIANEQKEESQNQTPPPSNAGNKKTVKPIITYADQYGNQVEVGGYVPGIVEDNGTCTARFIKGSTSFTKTVQAIRNASSVNCPAIISQNSEFVQKGIWQVQIEYNSPSASGTSDKNSFEVK